MNGGWCTLASSSFLPSFTHLGWCVVFLLDQLVHFGDHTGLGQEVSSSHS